MNREKPLLKILKNLDLLLTKEKYLFCLLTGSANIVLHDTTRSQNVFIKDLKNKEHDIDILIVANKFGPISFFDRNRISIPPEKIVQNFNQGKLGIISTKTTKSFYIFSLHFVHPKFFRILCSLRGAEIPYYRCFPLRDYMSLHYGFRNSRDYFFSKTQEDSQGLLIFRHTSVINSHFYLNDFQSMILLGQNLTLSSRLVFFQQRLLREICKQALRENSFSLKQIQNIFKYNLKKWPQSFRNLMNARIKEQMKLIDKTVDI